MRKDNVQFSSRHCFVADSHGQSPSGTVPTIGFLAMTLVWIGMFILLSTVNCQLLTPVYAGALNHAEALYLQGRYSESINECAVNIARSNNIDEAYYLLGLNCLKINDLQRARDKFKFVVDRYHSSRYYQQAKLGLADTYLQEQKFKEARGLYERMLNESGKLAPGIYLRIGECAMKTGNWQEAKKYFQIIKDRYPLSLEAKETGKFVYENEYFFTVQIGTFSNQNNALKLKDKLKGRNYDSYIAELILPQNKLYRVRVGKFKKRQEAEAVSEALEKDGYPAKIYP